MLSLPDCTHADQSDGHEAVEPWMDLGVQVSHHVKNLDNLQTEKHGQNRTKDPVNRKSHEPVFGMRN